MNAVDNDQQHEEVEYDEIPEWPDPSQLEIAEDFLPLPDQLVFNETNNADLFAELLESAYEGGAILRGEQLPSRKFEVGSDGNVEQI